MPDEEEETVTDEEEPSPETDEPVGRRAVHQRRSARRTEALTLRLAGMSYAQIGERLEITANGARELIVRNLERADNRNVEVERSIENARLDRAQAAVWSKVLDGDLSAVDTFLRISSRRAKMNGLDEPTSINMSIGIRNEMENALTELQEVVLGEVVDVRDEPAGDEGADD